MLQPSASRLLLTNSDSGDDRRGDDCNNARGTDNDSSGRGSDKGNKRRGNNNGDEHADEHAYDGHSRPAPCPRTMTSLCLEIYEAI